MLPAVTNRLDPRSTLLAALAAALVALYVLAGGGNFALDDGWIHQTFARNLAQSGEWAFIPGQPTAASTSPLYTVLLSMGYRLGVEYRLWAHAWGALALAAAGLIGVRLAQPMLPNDAAGPYLAGAALVLTWHHVWAAASGMETMLFGTLTLWVILLARQHPFAASAMLTQSIRHGALFGAAAALTTLARPEGILLAGLAGLLLLPWLRHTPRRFAAWTLSAALLFFLVLSPYLLLNLRLTGGLLPNTAAAKFEQHAILLALPLPLRVWQLSVAILAGGQALLLPGLLPYVLLARRRPLPDALLHLLPLWWSLALILLYALRLPASYQHGRYVLPALPSLVLVGSVGMRQLLRGTARRPLLPRVMGRAWAIALLVVYALFAFVTGPQVYRTDVAVIDGEMVTAAHWIRDNLPPQALLAIHDIGAVGYFAPRPLLDIAGLVTPALIPFVADADALWRYLQAQDARYLLAFPNQIPGGSPADARLCPIYTTNAAITQQLGEPNMTLYRLAWDRRC